MLRTGLVAVLLLGIGSTAIASDRVRVFVTFDSGYHDVDYRYYGGSDRYRYAGGGRDDRRWDDRRRHDSRWDDRRWDNRRHDGWYAGRYYSAPRGYYYPRWYGYSRGYSGGRYCPDRFHDGRDWHRH